MKPARRCLTCRKPLTTGAKYWHWQCVPKESRAERARKNTQAATARRHEARYAVEIDRLVVDGRIQRRALMELLARERDLGWHLGYAARRAAEARRQATRGEAA